MEQNQLLHYQAKLEYETDSWDLYVALKEGKPWVVIDGRAVEAYEQEHIPGAVNLPHRDISETTTESLDRDKIYVCYCDGIGCNASTKTALKLHKLGFKVRELLGGLDWWKRDGYATEGQQAQDGAEVICGC